MFKDLDFEDVKSMYSSTPLLIVTANEIETVWLHKALKPCDNDHKIIRTAKGNHTYFIGVFGSYLIVHVRCDSMGSVLPGSSLLTISHAIEVWGIRGVIMIGIAMGFDKSYNIGDVLISEYLRIHEPERIGKDSTISRGPKVASGDILLNRFRSSYDWKYPEDIGSDLKVRFGEIVSTEKLVDNREFNKDLKGKYPEAIGLEMEGAGLYSACKANKIQEWIIVKSICDYGDGFKKRNKKTRQELAIRSAISLCQKVFENKFNFKELQIQPYAQTGVKTSFDFRDAKTVLFDQYKLEFEPYYIERNVDHVLTKSINFQSNVWVHGTSGLGKTVAITRAIMMQGKKFYFLSLANCIGDITAISFLKELNSRLSELGQAKIIIEKDIGILIKQCAQLIQALKEREECILFIEEIPFDDSEETFSLFTRAILAIELELKSTYNINAKFILSSIMNPFKIWKIKGMKFSENFIEVSFKDWNLIDQKKLTNLIIKELKFNSDEMLSLAHNAEKIAANPRKLKIYFRNYIFNNC